MKPDPKTTFVNFKPDPKVTKHGIKIYQPEEVMIPMGYHEKLPNGTMIRFIADDKLDDKKVLGRAVAINLGHAVTLGIKYKDNFLSRVQGYRIVDDDEPTKTTTQATGVLYTTYEFYELAE